MISRKSDEYIAEKSIADLCIKIADTTGGSTGSLDFFSFTRNPFSDWHAKNFYIDIEKGEINSKVDILCSHITKGEVPGILLLSSRAISEEMNVYLKEKGFTLFHEQTGMVAKLDNVDVNLDETAAGINVIEQEDRVEEWVEAAGTAFGKMNNPSLFKLLLKDKAIKLYAYTFEGKIVATALAYICDGIVGLHMVGTVPAYRGRGIATNITKRALQDAIAAGIKISSLQASKLGKPIYEKIGFISVSEIVHWRYTR